MNESLLTTLFAVFGTKFRDSFEKQISSTGLHSGQVFIMKTLWQNDGLSQAEMVKILNLSPPTIYNMVIKLEKLGLVDVKKDTIDARIMRVFLTEKGIQIKPEVEEQIRVFENKIFGVLTDAEKMMCSLLIQKLTDNILII